MILTNTPVFWLTLGGFFSFAGTMPLIISAWKNRDNLKGYNLGGALLTFSAIVCYQIFQAFNMRENWLAFGLQISTLLYWGVVSGALLWEKIRKLVDGADIKTD